MILKCTYSEVPWFTESHTYETDSGDVVFDNDKEDWYLTEGSEPSEWLIEGLTDAVFVEVQDD